MKNKILLLTMLAMMLASCANTESEAEKTPENSSAASTTTAAAAAPVDTQAGSEDASPADAAPTDTDADGDQTSDTATTTSAAAASSADTQSASQSVSSSASTTSAVTSAPVKTAAKADTTTTAPKKTEAAAPAASKKAASSTAATTTTKKSTTTTTTTTTTAASKKTAAPKPQTEQDKRIAEFAQRVTNGKSDKLRALFDAVAGDIEFCYSLQPYPDLTRSDWEIQAADNMLTRGYGNCFEFAALFARSAQYLGYDVKCIHNDVTTYNGNTAHHCWTEYRENGKVYVIDPETHYEVLKGWQKIHRCDFYKIDYSQTPYPMNYFPEKN